jgi:hypothetical protein
LKIKGLFWAVPSSVSIEAVNQELFAARKRRHQGTVISQEVDYENSKVSRAWQLFSCAMRLRGAANTYGAGRKTIC